jgi:hypothetical protein
MAVMTGCSGGGHKNTSGIAPDSLAGHTISVQVSGGAQPFASSGTYVFTPTSGDGHSGNYQLQGQGGVQSNIGTYTWTKTGNNTATLLETEQSGTQVQNTLVFETLTTGRIHSSSSNAGGSQDGAFTLN